MSKRFSNTFNLQSYGALFHVMAIFAILATLVNCGLTLAANIRLLNWPSPKTTGPGFLADNRQRVSAALAEYKNHKISPAQYLCAITGISNVREGVGIKLLDSDLHQKWRVLGVAGAGAGMWSIDENADVLANSDLRPDLVVIGLTPMEMLDTLLPPDQGGLTPIAPAGAEGFYFDLKKWVWFHERRTDVNLSVQDAFQEAHDHIMSLFGIPPELLDPKNPWREMIHVMSSIHASDATLRGGLSWAKSEGAFDPTLFERSTKSWTLFQKLLKRVRGKGAQVMIVLMPEHSWLRAHDPPGFPEEFRQKAREVLKGDLTLLDYRDAIEDDGFADLVHLNARGRLQFSKLLAAAIKNVVLDHPPLMSVANS